MTDAVIGSRACFATLGIAPTADVRAIKRAYAGVLKTIDLATEPDRFARLRSDYEIALAQAPHITDPPVATASPIAADTPATSVPASAPNRALWRVGDTAPRHRLKNARKSLADIDNMAGWPSAEPAVRMPPILSPPRGGVSPSPRHGGDDDGERDAIAALLDDATPGRPRLLDAGLRRYGWDMVGTDLAGFGAYQGWLASLLDERARWQDVAPRQRRKPEALLARIAAAQPSGSVADLYRWQLFATTLQSFPLWSAFVAGSYRLDEWRAADTQAPAWKRQAVKIRQRPLPFLVIMWIVFTAVPLMLTDMVDERAAWLLIVFFGLAQMVILTLIAAAIGIAIGRRMQPGS